MAKKKHNKKEEVEAEEEEERELFWCIVCWGVEWCMQLVVEKAGSYFEKLFSLFG